MSKTCQPAAATRRQIRLWLWIFIVCLVLSGLTAFPLQTETRWLADVVRDSPLGNHFPALADRAAQVRDGLADTDSRYPFLAYGTDWLAFAHLVIAVAFWGPLKDPVRNVWVIRWAMIACAGVIPLALICGPLRGIPLYWRFVDTSFGVIGVIPLLIVHRAIRRLEWAQAVEQPNGFTTGAAAAAAAIATDATSAVTRGATTAGAASARAAH